MPEEYRPADITMTSYFPCPRCSGNLTLVEHYYPVKSVSGMMGPAGLESVTLTCPVCKISSDGLDELEAYRKLKPE